MRRFEYFLYENFNADLQASNPDNPRLIFGKDSDFFLSEIADHPTGTYQISNCTTYEKFFVSQMIRIGILRFQNGALLFDCPIFLAEDTATLQQKVADSATALADILEGAVPAIRDCCSKIDNHFCVEQNLYHILCGMIFDGLFFDFLSEHRSLATSRTHPSGLDYLVIIYEKCDSLQKFSNQILCSYNRFANQHCSLQSFGDAQGNRFDFYRFLRLMEQKKLSKQYWPAQILWQNSTPPLNKEIFLSDVLSFLQTGRCADNVLKLLELFGYVRNGSICVPIYSPDHRPYIMKIEAIVEQCLGEKMSKALSDLAVSLQITTVSHGVDPLEIANELYHILFGSLNEELIKRKIVAAPPCFPGEGRYQKCIEILA